uniref:Protein-PII uridylyltransferase N-terminal domain-containing protein n=1 Tax=Branchiostoma floridae TaxID=7739 RepID=C3ZRI4_BRAFL|eukprot:XP_002588773.1 hypothetical protein BRAFLDRAFT_89799 [Branchiostoma floridae]
MSDINIISLANKLQDLELEFKSQSEKEIGYGRALREAILGSNNFMEVEVLKSLGDLHLQKAKLSRDSAEFDKAAALYAAALLRCTDLDMGQTLEHRIGYMEKLSRQLLQGYTPHQESSEGTDRNNALRVAKIFAESDEKLVRNYRKSWQPVEETYTEIKYKDHVKEGESSLARADLDSAEQHFAAALKMTHVRDPTAQQYQREVEPLCKLGEVYSKRGQQTGDGGDFVKAAALYNAAIARSEDQVLNGNIVTAIIEIEKLFLKCILDISHNVSPDNTENHKKQLKEMRDQIKLEMETIDQQLDPYVHDEDDPCVKEIEAKRAQAVRHLFENIAQQRKEFISLLVEECIGLMGPPPCKYALIGLGSQATGLVTPYSDLEFAILVEEESEQHKLYFHNLTHYLHLKVVNLGETILPALGIKSLNDFFSEDPLDNWYYDSVTPRGFAFDGSMPKASKTPLGRQGAMDKPPSELICTPENMASILQNDVTLYLKEGYHLASILRNPCLVAGDQDLIDMYMGITVKILQADRGKMAQQLAQETQRENIEKYKEKETARLIDVKKNIYRFPAVAVDCLALSSGIIPTTVWKTIEDMENQQVISPNNAHHLTVLTSISAELRLRTYIANGGQKENLSALASMERMNAQESTPQMNALKAASQVCHLHNEKQLIRYYQTSAPLKKALSEWSEKTTGTKSCSDFYDNSPSVKGMIYLELCKYSVGIKYYEEALQRAETDQDKINSLKDLGHAWFQQGDYKKSVRYSTEALELHRSIHGQDRADNDTATILSQLGAAWGHLDNPGKAINYLEQTLQIDMAINSHSTGQGYIAMSLHNLGSACSYLGDERQAIRYYENALEIYTYATWIRLGEHRQAISHYEQALQMYRSIKGQNSAHLHIASSLIGLGGATLVLGDYIKGISYIEEALKMLMSIHGQSIAHPHIAPILNFLGLACGKVGDHRKATRCFRQALQMYRTIHGQTAAHPQIALSLRGLAGELKGLGAISYLEQALQMYRCIHGQGTAHSDIAGTLNALGKAWGELGDHRKAISYHEQALTMYGIMYGDCQSQSEAHPEFARTHRMMGMAFEKLGDSKTALCHLEQALAMYRHIKSPTTENLDIAKSFIYNDLGLVCYSLKDYEKAIDYHQQALEMLENLSGQDTAHDEIPSSIASSLSNLGRAWCAAGDPGKAISYREQALQMERSIYGESTAHPHIALSLSGLGTAWSKLGDHKKAISYHEQALKMLRSIHGQSTAHPDIALSLHNLATAWYNGDHKTTISYQEQALKMYKRIHGPTKAHPDTAESLGWLGMACEKLGDYKTAVSYHEQALKMYRSVHGQSTAHSDIAGSLSGLGIAWGELGDPRKAMSYHEQALKMFRSIHGQNTAHPHTALSLRGLGIAWGELGDPRKAISYLEQALQMYRRVHCQGTAHSNIAGTLNTLGIAWSELGDHRKAISYHEQALQMYRHIHGQTAEHPDIANSLCYLGTVWYILVNYRKAISYHEQALQMRKSIYGYNTVHPDIARSLYNIGKDWRYSGHPRKAISFIEQALQMMEKMGGLDSTVHPNEHAGVLRDLGAAWCDAGDARKAISYYEQALQMYRSRYGQNTPHRYIASMLRGIGSAWFKLGDHSKAISYFEQALQMNKSIYGQTAAHSRIISSLNDLGMVLAGLGNHTRAQSVLKEALAMARQLHPQDKGLLMQTELVLAMVQVSNNNIHPCHLYQLR